MKNASFSSNKFVSDLLKTQHANIQDQSSHLAMIQPHWKFIPFLSNGPQQHKSQVSTLHGLQFFLFNRCHSIVPLLTLLTFERNFFLFHFSTLVGIIWNDISLVDPHFNETKRKKKLFLFLLLLFYGSSEDFIATFLRLIFAAKFFCFNLKSTVVCVSDLWLEVVLAMASIKFVAEGPWAQVVQSSSCTKVKGSFLPRNFSLLKCLILSSLMDFLNKRTFPNPDCHCFQVLENVRIWTNDHNYALLNQSIGLPVSWLPKGFSRECMP